MKARKELGQHFLTDRGVARAMARTIPKDIGSVLEIGPGPGILTEEVLRLGFDVTAVEIDPRFSDLLRTRYRDNDKVQIIQGDILDLLTKEKIDTYSYIVSNLPFNISTPLITRLLDMLPYPWEDGYSFGGATIMFQKEYAQRLMARHRSKEYGRLTVMFKVKLDASLLMEVPRVDFDPQPEVDASVLIIRRREPPFERIDDPTLFDHIVRESFQRRRKKMKNIPIGANEVLDRMAKADLRPEDLSISDFISLANHMAKD